MEERKKCDALQLPFYSFIADEHTTAIRSPIPHSTPYNCFFLSDRKGNILEVDAGEKERVKCCLTERLGTLDLFGGVNFCARMWVRLENSMCTCRKPVSCDYRLRGIRVRIYFSFLGER